MLFLSTSCLLCVYWFFCYVLSKLFMR